MNAAGVTRSSAFRDLLRRRVRQWAPLFVIGVGGGACWTGYAFGQPNSWVWWSGGVLLGAGIVLLVVRGRTTSAEDSPPD